MNEKPKVGITTGDLNGIGIELIIKTFSDHRLLELCTPIVFASNKAINFYKKGLNDFPFTYTSTKDINQLHPKQVNVFTCWEEEVNIQPGVLTESGGKYAVRSLSVAGQCLKDGDIDILITAPLHKGNTQTNDYPYSGHTPYLKALFQANDVVMILYNDQLKVALLTEHIPVQDVSKHVTKKNILNRYGTLEQTLIKDFGISQPKIAVLALNPHAGDEGHIGQEEINEIIPAIDELSSKGHLAFGPYGADAFFARGAYQQFDAVLAMYHDQGLIPFKMLSFGGGVNYTGGLPAIRTSPDHGTAFDIAGKGIADPSSFLESIYQGIDLWRQRKNYAHYTSNPLKRGRKEKE